ncbi:MAG: iron ABC transporter permease [Deltaproteobacteria bacterium]|nr:MAG: iron ABC transporter permease [Deltaproteobacteria bacterium]
MSSISRFYRKHRQGRLLWLGLFTLLLIPAAYFIMLSGAAEISGQQLWESLLTGKEGFAHLVVWQIRLPRLVGALLGGAGLALAGTVLQAVLKNPLAAPTTLGIAQGAAFGAALGITYAGLRDSLPVLQGGFSGVDESVLVSFFAFSFSLLTTFIIILLTRLRRAGKESIILAGVALSSLFMAGTTFLQYFADETQLAMIVHWTFGDLARASWSELYMMGVVTIFSMLYFFANRLNYNALLAGDEVAQSLGVNVVRLRLVSMSVATLATAITVTFFGILGFVGLIAPHMGRRLVGSDNRYLLPLSAILGALILLFADLLGQFLLDPVALPAGVITSFLGTPVFLLLLFGRRSS